jgi:hypothetical protein
MFEIQGSMRDVWGDPEKSCCLESISQLAFIQILRISKEIQLFIRILRLSDSET